MKNYKVLLLAAVAAFFASCNSDDDGGDVPQGNYDNGILVLNEGGQGTVTYISDDLNTVQQDIFNAVNPDAEIALGSYTQNIFFDGDRAFIISGSNFVTVVNRYTFEYIGRVETGFDAPRYGVAYNGKAYVTNNAGWSTGADDYVAVFNTQTLALEEPISINNYVEYIIEENGKLYVANGSFGSGTGVTVIDPATKTISATIPTDFSPTSIDEEDGTLFIMTASSSGAGQLVKANLANNQVVAEIDLPATISSPKNLKLEDDSLFFTAGGKIYKFAENATAFTDTPFVDTNSTSYYMAYGFNVEDGKVFISEAADDFTSDGKIFVYSAANGQLLKEIGVGIGPNGFYFN